MSNAIPTKQRQALGVRDNHQCQRCGTQGSDYHHRRRRAVKTHFQHCLCNAVLLCRTCHGWVHSNPAKARELGLIVSAHDETPYLQPIRTFAGWLNFHCDGGITYLPWENEWSSQTPDSTN